MQQNSNAGPLYALWDIFIFQDGLKKLYSINIKQLCLGKKKIQNEPFS